MNKMNKNKFKVNTTSTKEGRNEGKGCCNVDGDCV